MISPIDLISEIERNARKKINMGEEMAAKMLLLDVMENIKKENFLENELPDLALTLKRIHTDFLAIKDYDGGFQSLYLIYKMMIGKLSIINDLKNYLNKIQRIIMFQNMILNIRNVKK